MRSKCSTHTFDTNTLKYEPKVDAENGLSDVAISGYLAVDAPVGAVTTLVATLPGTPVLSADVALVNVIGIEFYQKVDTDYYLLASGNALKVVELF